MLVNSTCVAERFFCVCFWRKSRKCEKHSTNGKRVGWLRQCQTTKPSLKVKMETVLFLRNTALRPKRSSLFSRSCWFISDTLPLRFIETHNFAWNDRIFIGNQNLVPQKRRLLWFHNFHAQSFQDLVAGGRRHYGICLHGFISQNLTFVPCFVKHKNRSLKLHVIRCILILHFIPTSCVRKKILRSFSSTSKERNSLGHFVAARDASHIFLFSNFSFCGYLGLFSKLFSPKLLLLSMQPQTLVCLGIFLVFRHFGEGWEQICFQEIYRNLWP